MIDAHPTRDAVAVALAWLNDDAERMAAVLTAYELESEELHLVAALLDLLRLPEDRDGLRGQLLALALAGAGRRPR